VYGPAIAAVARRASLPYQPRRRPAFCLLAQDGATAGTRSGAAAAATAGELPTLPSRPRGHVRRTRRGGQRGRGGARVEKLAASKSTKYLRVTGQLDDLQFSLHHLDDVPAVVAFNDFELVTLLFEAPVSAIGKPL
jgi:hypothetical protein